MMIEPLPVADGDARSDQRYPTEATFMAGCRRASQTVPVIVDFSGPLGAGPCKRTLGPMARDAVRAAKGAVKKWSRLQRPTKAQQIAGAVAELSNRIVDGLLLFSKASLFDGFQGGLAHNPRSGVLIVALIKRQVAAKPPRRAFRRLWQAADDNVGRRALPRRALDTFKHCDLGRTDPNHAGGLMVGNGACRNIALGAAWIRPKPI